MLRARTNDGTVILGLDAENVKRLQQGLPIHVNLQQLGGAHSVLIMDGDTVQDIARELEKSTGAPLPPPTSLDALQKRQH